MSEHAVLLIIFNRPKITEQVLNAIRSAGVSRLYVAADGGRENNPRDFELCRQVRDLVSNIDWPCEVITLFREENRGCRFGPSEAIDWFFSHEEAGIILEDDCLPHPDFFEYCDWALSEFKTNKKIWHINGNNFDASKDLYRAAVDFTSLAQVWGWATWADRWQSHQVNPFHIRAEAEHLSGDWSLSELAKQVKKLHIERLCYGLDAWDYQWQVKILNQGGLCVSPKSNLISNIGDSADASHTKKDNRTHLPVSSLEQPLTHAKVAINIELTHWYERKMGLSRRSFALAYSSLQFLRQVVRGIRRLLYSNRETPVVIASSGRSGSTLLCDALAAGYINNKLGLKSTSFPGRHLFIMARCFVDRLDQVKSTKCPIQKTHALLDEKYLPDAKYIFVYGDPLDSAISVKQVTKKKGTRWFEKHLYHLQSEAHPDIRNILSEDILNYEKQLRSWLTVKHQNVMPIYYEELWDKQDAISEFVGFPIKLPKRLARSKKAKPEQHNHLLFDKLSNLMDEFRRTC